MLKKFTTSGRRLSREIGLINEKHEYCITLEQSETCLKILYSVVVSDLSTAKHMDTKDAFSQVVSSQEYFFTKYIEWKSKLFIFIC